MWNEIRIIHYISSYDCANITMAEFYKKYNKNSVWKTTMITKVNQSFIKKRKINYVGGKLDQFYC